MKIDVLFALPGPRHTVQGNKLLIVAAATEHEDPNYLKSVIADVADSALEAGAYRSVHKVTLELEDSLVLALSQGTSARTPSVAPAAGVPKSMLH